MVGVVGVGGTTTAPPDDPVDPEEPDVPEVPLVPAVVVVVVEVVVVEVDAAACCLNGSRFDSPFSEDDGVLPSTLITGTPSCVGAALRGDRRGEGAELGSRLREHDGHGHDRGDQADGNGP